MKKTARLMALASVLALSLAACGDNGDGDNGSSAEESFCKAADGDGPKIGLAYDVGGIGDQSFNDSAYAGSSVLSMS